jgi:glycosyltransferase involved in cell wall biosynthesis
MVQPFSLVTGQNGGSRILRALCADAPCDVLDVCTAARRPSAERRSDAIRTIHLPVRPALGRLERSRVSPYAGALEVAGFALFRRRLGDLLRRERVTCVHGVAHSLDFIALSDAAHALGLPYLLSVHDEIGYALEGRPQRPLALKRIGAAWREAEHRFVITEAIGEEYDRRYGKAPWTVITDGVEPAEPVPDRRRRLETRVYFVGSLHLSYVPNFAICVDAVRALEKLTTVPARLTLRGTALPFPHDATYVEALPFASQQVVRRDTRDVDVMYLPLPLEDGHDDFLRYSLPTKLVTYLGSGRPIVYHGPAYSSSAVLLRKWNAGVVVSDADPQALAAGFQHALSNADELTAAARRLAAQHFSLPALRERFWKQFR